MVRTSLNTFLFFISWLISLSASGVAQPSISKAVCFIDSMSVVNNLCNGACNGTITVFAQGSGPLFYQWPEIPGANTASVTGLCAGNYVVIVTDSTGCVITDSVVVSEPPPIAFNLTIVDATCPGGCSGSVTVVPADSLPYTYQWPGYVSTGSTLGSLCQGPYTVIITNNQGCSVFGSGLVGYDPPFDLNFSATPASCLTSCNGSATVFANGIPPFFYQWGTGPIQNTQGAINLCSGNLLVSVSDSTGCVVTDTVFIPLAPPPVINLSAISPACYGGCDGEAQVQVTGTGNYIFEWNSNPVLDSIIADGLCSGNATLQVTDLLNGCVIFDTVQVIDPAETVLFFNSSPSACNNICTGIAGVSPFGAAPFTYVWQSGATTQVDDSLCPGNYIVTVADSLGCSISDTVTVESQDLNFNVTNANCNTTCDGIAEVIISPATTWQVTWSTVPVQTTATATQLCPGNYSVSIIDSAGCQVTDTVNINVLQPVNAVYSLTQSSCPGYCDGSIAVELTGNGPFTISWPTLPGANSDSVSQLCSGLYPVIITDTTGCILVDSILLAEPILPQLTYTTISNTCYTVCDASAVILPVTPGSYTYEWQTNPSQFGAGAADLCPGFTLVEVTTGNGCVFMDSVLIIGTYPFNIGMNVVNPSCYGSCDGFIGTQVFGGTPGYTYAWSNGYVSPQVLNLCNGTYVVTITDANGCVDSSTATIAAPDSMTISFNVTDASCISCADGSINATVTGGTLNYNYFWTPGGLGTNSLTGLTPGVYNLCVADGNLCIQCTDVVVSFFNSVHEPGDEKNLGSVYPNPFTKLTTIDFYDSTIDDIGIIEFEVFDVFGRIINDFSVLKVNHFGNNYKLNITADNAVPGIYVFKISHNSDFVVTGKFVVQH